MYLLIAAGRRLLIAAGSALLIAAPVVSSTPSGRQPLDLLPSPGDLLLGCRS